MNSMVDLRCPHCHAPYRFDPTVPVSISEDTQRRGPLTISQAEQVIHECSPTKETP